MFGNRQDKTKEQMRKNDRELNKVTRDLDKERAANEREQKKLEMEIKKAVKANNKPVAAALAKQLVQMRKANERTLMAQGRIRGVQMQQKSMAANQKVADSMAQTTKVMAKASPDVRKTAQTMQQFQKQNERMQMQEEMLDDAMAVALSDDEGAEDEVINQVLSEIGVDINAQLPQGRQAPLPATGSVEADDDLMRRLNQLQAPPE
ncbi:charged multivesicular body protein 2a-like [Convolutriloba macropyga]|uniref:charged multivesicular body protein 2a-like n=1 Tax=Convolutriloba macropyga TaxID=536237 RepID=UPI003F522B7D